MLVQSLMVQRLGFSGDHLDSANDCLGPVMSISTLKTLMRVLGEEHNADRTQSVYGMTPNTGREGGP